MLKFHVKHLMLLSLLSAFLLPALAQKMYRCPGAGGSTTFTDTPCAAGSGLEVTVKPSGGAAPAQAKPDPQTRGAMDKRNAEYNALLTPECRRAREAFMAKTQQKDGVQELMKEDDPISKAWSACTFGAKEALEKLNAQDRARVDADERKRNEQSRITQRKLECATKQKALDDSNARIKQLSEQDIRAVAALTADIQLNCR